MGCQHEECIHKVGGSAWLVRASVCVCEGGGTSLAVQRFRFRASKAGDAGSIPSRGTKILHAVRPKKKE